MTDIERLTRSLCAYVTGDEHAKGWERTADDARDLLALLNARALQEAAETASDAAELWGSRGSGMSEAMRASFERTVRAKGGAESWGSRGAPEFAARTDDRLDALEDRLHRADLADSVAAMEDVRERLDIEDRLAALESGRFGVRRWVRGVVAGIVSAAEVTE